MISKFFLISILNVLLGFNFSLSPLSLIEDLPHRADSAGTVTKEQNPYLLPTTEANYFPIRDWGIAEPSIRAKSAVLYDLESEKMLFERNSKERLPVASLTKLMSAIIIVENSNMEDVIEVGKSAIEKSRTNGGGSDLSQGEKIKAIDLLKLMLIKSSNDAAYSFEGYLSGRGINLVDEMNKKAGELEMNDTYFTEAAGLDDQNSFSTSQDLIKLLKYSFRYGFLYDILKTSEAEVASIDGNHQHKVFNTNQLLGILLNIIGGKTGFTEFAGGSMILVVGSPDNGKLISVVLGSSDRFEDTKELVGWAGKAYIWK